MKITSVRIKRNNSSENSLLGTASIQFDDCLIVHNIKLIQLKDKRIVSFPSKKVQRYVLNDGQYDQNFEYTDIVHPSNKEFRSYIEEELFKIYDNEASEVENYE